MRNKLISKVADKAAAKSTSETSGTTTSAKSPTEGDQRMLMFKIQKLQTAVQEMLSFFSTKLKKENDLHNTLIRNMA